MSGSGTLVIQQKGEAARRDLEQLQNSTVDVTEWVARSLKPSNHRRKAKFQQSLRQAENPTNPIIRTRTLCRVDFFFSLASKTYKHDT
jgi:hypothetical protein